MAKNYVFTLGTLLLLSLYCKAQVEPFTKFYTLDPEWDGHYFKQTLHTADSGYIAAFNQNVGFYDRTNLLKLDKYGEIEWRTILEDTAYLNIESQSVCIDNDGNYYLAGSVQIGYTTYADYNAMIAKFAPNGELLWCKTYGRTPDNDPNNWGGESLRKIISGLDNKLIAVGSRGGCGVTYQGNAFVMCIDTNGEEIWNWDDCDSENYTSYFNSIVQSPSGRLYAIGTANIKAYYNGSYWNSIDQGFVVKMNLNGSILDTFIFGKPQYQLHLKDVEVISENRFALVGWVADSNSNSLTNLKHSLIIVDTLFNSLYQNNIAIGSDGGYQQISIDKDTNIFVNAITYPSNIMAGSEYRSDFLWLKYDQKGRIIWKKYVGGEFYSSFMGHQTISADNDGGATFGCTFSLHAGPYFCTAALYKLDSLGNGDYPISDFPYPDSVEYIIYNQNSIETIDDVAIYPNPAKGEFIIEIPDTLVNSSFMMISITGQLVVNNILTQAQKTIKTSELKNGIYIIKIQKDNIVVLRKIVVNK
ncbi:MAG: T9SS type A sorting domain-containing protein [Bacteroidales bacterium]|nr:T9SS type A sorting domain-containing protein [Bacteroidales bacterium]